ncbi:uncharacterized protein LOC109827929 [Asparagus officinalis]|uniref:uncharacterized protein LOC109827929 n=1 Tax=Asparagus officinalis TaxID=4686 RepID=UPI00098E8692|nr:uncharacterized protein LOC109827929 [Asparagus officinalis]
MSSPSIQASNEEPTVEPNVEPTVELVVEESLSKIDGKPKKKTNVILNCPPIPHPQPFDSNRELLPRPFHPQQSSPCPSCCVDGGDGGDGDGGDYGVFAASHRPPPPPATAIGASLMMETGEALDLRFPWRILKILWLGFVKGAIGIALLGLFPRLRSIEDLAKRRLREISSILCFQSLNNASLATRRRSCLLLYKAFRYFQFFFSCTLVCTYKGAYDE